MKRIICLICILAAMQLACGIVPLATSTPAPNDTMTAEPKIDLEKPLRNGGNAVSSTPVATYVTASRSVYIRAEPSHTAEIVGHLMNGESVTVLECSGLWARIGASRWVNSIYLKERC